jgi:excisionase family DNA binding protein
MSVPASIFVRQPLTRADALTVREVGELLGMPKSTIADLARRGDLPSRKLGRRRIFVRDQIETVLRGE